MIESTLQEILTLTNRIASIGAGQLNTTTIVTVPAGKRIKLYRVEVSSRVITSATENELTIAITTGALVLGVGEYNLPASSSGNASMTPPFVLSPPDGTFLKGLVGQNLVVNLINNSASATDDIAVNVYYRLSDF